MKRIGFIFLLLTLAFLSACGSQTGQGENSGSTAELETIIITEPVRGYHWAPVYLAETLGYLEEEGLRAEFQTVSGSDSSIPVLAGEAQFGLRGVEMALMANEAGQGCKILFSTTSHYPFQLIGASAEFATVESLRGQVIAGGQGPTSAPHAFAKAVLMDGGLEPNVDASVISMQSAGYLAAIAGGEIQAAVATNPWASKMLLDNGGVVIIDGSDEEAMERLMGTTTYELFTLFAADAYIAEQPETVQKLVTATARAAQWMDSATPEEIAQALSPLFGGMDEEILYSAQQDKKRHIYSATGLHTESGFAAAVALTKLSGGISTDLSAEEIYDESFLKAKR